MLILETCLLWLRACPVIAPGILNADFLPSFEGWSISAGKSAVRKDILGNPRSVLELKVSRRATVPDNDARLAVERELTALADWAEANPPENARVLSRGLPRFVARSASGVEDHAITITIEEQ